MVKSNKRVKKCNEKVVLSESGQVKKIVFHFLSSLQFVDNIHVMSSYLKQAMKLLLAQSL